MAANGASDYRYPLLSLQPHARPFTMQATRSLAAPKKSLLLCFDAFGTLFTPNVPIGVAYAEAATRYGIDCGDTKEAREVWLNFKKAWKMESKSNPNYGNATGMGAEKWWGNVSS